VYSGSGFSGRVRVSTERTVDAPNNSWVRMEPGWLLIEQLLKGTRGIRQGHRKFLPQFPREADESYDVRLSKAVLSPFYKRLELLLAGMLTRKPVRLTDVSDQVTEQLFDVDLQGNDLQTWLFNTARVALRYGHVGVLVDAPRAGENGRPYWITISPRELLGWRTEIADGKQRLTMLRIAETVTVPDGKYGEKDVERVRVLTPGAYEIHEKDEKGDYKVVDEGRTSLSEIPFAVAYANRTGVMESIPPLDDIAELNLQHYQVSSDLSNILSVSAIPLLAIYGFPQSAEEISAGASEALALPESARSEYIEPSGNSFDAQFKQLEQIENKINGLGLAAVLGAKLVGESAEAKRIDRSQGDSTMMVIAQQMQDLIDNCLRFHAEYLQQPVAGSSQVNRDFMGQRLEPQEIQALLQLYTAGTITQDTLLNELANGDVLSEDFDIEEEVEATQNGGLIEMEQPQPEPREESTMPEAEADVDELAGQAA
jgi:hypothetical protein